MDILHLAFIAFILLGTVIGWLVVYFVRKYEKYDPRVLRDTALLFFGTGCLESLLFFMDSKIALVVLMAYIIGTAVGFFIHWIYQFIVAKLTAPKFLSPRSKYNLLAGCSLSDDYKSNTEAEYQLECINQGYGQLCKGVITEEEFCQLVKKSGLTGEVFRSLTSCGLGDMFLSPELAAYIKAKGIFEK